MPETFGRYRLEELIGRGGMGEVWRAYDTVNDRMVALKRLPAELATDQQFTERFRRESKLAAGLTEAHIIPIHDYGTIDGLLYIDMRLVDGDDLADVLSNEGRLTPARAVDLVRQVALALDAAHAAGLVHRDVTPKNILITGTRGNEFAYLIDFGISRDVRRDADDRAITGENMLVGTPAYMSPERFGRSVPNRRMDVYSLACVLFEMVTGEKAFPDEDKSHAHREQRPRWASAVRNDVPAALSTVLTKGMAKKPHLRYDSAGELAEAAKAALATTTASTSTRVGDPLGTSTRNDSSRARRTAVAPPPRRRPGVRALIGGAVALVVAGGVVWWALLPGSPRTDVEVGSSPQAVAVSQDGSTAYVANGGAGTVSVVDLVARRVTATIPVGKSPQAVALTRNGSSAYVANKDTDTISVIDVPTGRVSATIPVGDEPVAITMSKDGARAYVSNGKDASVSVIDTNGGKVTATIEVSDLPGDSLSGIAVSPDGARAYVAMTSFFGDDRVDVLDTVRRTVVNSIDVGEAPRGVAISGDGLHLYVANSASDQKSVSVIDVVNNAVTTTVPIDEVAQGVALGPDGRRAYVASSSSGTLTTIDTSSNLVDRSTSVSNNPTGVAISPDGKHAVVVSADADTLSVIDLPR